MKAVVDLDSSGRTELRLLDTIIPLAAGIVGAVAWPPGSSWCASPARHSRTPAEPSRHLAAG